MTLHLIILVVTDFRKISVRFKKHPEEMTRTGVGLGVEKFSK